MALRSQGTDGQGRRAATGGLEIPRSRSTPETTEKWTQNLESEAASSSAREQPGLSSRQGSGDSIPTGARTRAAGTLGMPSPESRHGSRCLRPGSCKGRPQRRASGVLLGPMEQARSLGPDPVPASRFLHAQRSTFLSLSFPIWKGNGPAQKSSCLPALKRGTSTEVPSASQTAEIRRLLAAPGECRAGGCRSDRGRGQASLAPSHQEAVALSGQTAAV